MQLIDSTGRSVRFVGVNVRDLAPGSGEPAQGGKGCTGWGVPEKAVYANVDAWGFNSVRLLISWANLEPTPPTLKPDGTLAHTYNAPFLESLDAAIHQFGERGIAVILNMHQNKWTPAIDRPKSGGLGSCPRGLGMPTWLYQGTSINDIPKAKTAFFANSGNVWQGYTDAWQFLAQRYAKDSTVIGADVFNEPYTTGSLTPADLHLDEFYQTVGQAIRSVNDHILLVLEDSQDQGNGQFGMTRRPPFDDVVYSFHLYRPNWDPLGQQTANDFVSRAEGWDVPVWIGEFNMFGGTNNVHGPREGWQDSSRAMLAYCRQHDVGWAVHAYAGANSVVVQHTEQPKVEVLAILKTGF
jgi:hypothetical protein